MGNKTTRVISNSQVQTEPISPRPRKERKYTLTKLGHEAVEWIKAEEAKALPIIKRES